MASSISVAQRTYQPGNYGPYSVDSFLASGPDYLEATFTVVNWPAAQPIITGTLMWNTGDGSNFAIESPPVDRFGNPLSVVKVRVGVPLDATGKVAVTSGNVTLTALATVTTAITVVAGTNP